MSHHNFIHFICCLGSSGPDLLRNFVGFFLSYISLIIVADMVTALYDYIGQEEGDLSFKVRTRSQGHKAPRSQGHNLSYVWVSNLYCLSSLSFSKVKALLPIFIIQKNISLESLLFFFPGRR